MQALNISNRVRKDYTTSDIVNLMSVDVAAIVDVIKEIHSILAFIVTMVLSFIYVWTIFGEYILATVETFIRFSGSFVLEPLAIVLQGSV